MTADDHVAISVSCEDGVITATAPGYEASFSAEDGAISALRSPGAQKAIFRSSAEGLWRVVFKDGSRIWASEFAGESPDHQFSWEHEAGENLLRFSYACPGLAVQVALAFGDSHIDISADITPASGVILDVSIPARLSFDPDVLNRLASPMNGNTSCGAAFLGDFFRKQPDDPPASWEAYHVGAAGYERLYGGPPQAVTDFSPYVKLKVTAAGREFFAPELIKAIESASSSVNRAPTAEQADVVLVDSDNGAYFSGCRLGGEGALWRIGAIVDWPDRNVVMPITVSVIDKLAAAAPAGKKVAVVILTNTPEKGGRGARAVHEWREVLAGSRAVAEHGAEYVEIDSPQALMEALAGDDHLAIVNPYGPWAPVTPGHDLTETVDAVGDYVRRGGNWFETNGVPFLQGMKPVEYFQYGASYPPAFADFFHFDTTAGAASVYRVQPRTWDAYAGADDPEAVLVPGKFNLGGSLEGGYCDRVFGAHIRPGATWRTPVVRLSVGETAAEGLADYCAANNIQRPLADKLDADLLAKLKQTVLVLYLGTCAEKIEHLHLLPPLSLVHFCDYLKGGFDKEYPDHLPPRPECGTPEEFRAFFDKCHELGHLVMPYTNPTWWCDLPKGPVFAAEGDAPLLKQLDGKPFFEQYAFNKTGYTVCHWDPAVRAANDETIRQFTEDYPADIFFQDQCGARHWRYDTNPNSPTPIAYVEGMVSMVQNDCLTTLLSTEAGFDRVVDYEVQLCGITYQIFPCEHRPPWTRLHHYDWPANTWELFPMAQYIAHDKCMLNHHDLAQFVQNPKTLSWTLALGYNMSYRAYGKELQDSERRQWLCWIDRVQKSVCARYVGGGLSSFSHERPASPTPEDVGVVRAVYGPVRVIANLGPVARSVDGRDLPAYGFVAEGGGVSAGHILDVDGNEAAYVMEGRSLWVYARAGDPLALPADLSDGAEVTVRFDGAPAATCVVTDGVLRLTVPQAPDAPTGAHLWHAQLDVKE